MLFLVIIALLKTLGPRIFSSDARVVVPLQLANIRCQLEAADPSVRIWLNS